MTEDVQYKLSLKDMLTGKLKEADVAAKGLETTMGGLKTVLAGVGAAFGVMAVGDFLRGSVAAYNESAQASAQLDASLRSTANAANLNRDALDAQALALMNTTLFDDDAITGAQGLLATFTNIKDKIYMDAVPAIADLATKMGGDLQGATIQVGKALNNPIQGITALTRVGVTFSEEQKKVIESLVKTGHTADAQRMILKELNTEFGGSAEAAGKAGTGSFTILQHQFMNVREEIGQMVVSIGTALMPAFQGIVTGAQNVVTFTKDVWHWMKENKLAFESLAVGVGGAIGAYLVYNVWQKAVVTWKTLQYMWLMRTEVATTLLATAQEYLNLVMSANPIGLIVVAIGALAAGLYYAWEKSETFRGGILGLWEVIKTVAPMIGNAIAGIGKMILGVLVPNPSLIKEGWTQMTGAFENAGEKIGTAWKTGYAKGIKKEDSITSPKAGSTFGKIAGVENTDPAKPKKDISAKGATANKAITINITIGKLIETFKIQTTNIQDSTGKIEEMVANALLAAVNDSSIVANI